MRNKSGKVLTIFAIIIAVLLISLTGVAIFFFQKEYDNRVQKESQLTDANTTISDQVTKIAELDKKIFLLTEKNKEADERINNLMDDLELEQGLREESKTESQTIRTELEKNVKEKELLSAELLSLKKSYSDLEAKLTDQSNENVKLAAQIKSLGLQLERMKSDPGWSQFSAVHSLENNGTPVPQNGETQKPELIPPPQSGIEGRILSVDVQTEFVIVDLGEKSGAVPGDFLSVYRGTEYLGDVKITRVQSEMSAADLIPPFSSRVVRKNDKVILKK